MGSPYSLVCRYSSFTRLIVSAMVVCECLGQASGAESKHSGEGAKSSDRERQGVKSTVLFMSWENVFKGRMEPMIDPSRVSEEGKKAIEGLQQSWNRKLKTNSHGLQPFFMPKGIRITVEKARKQPMSLRPDQPWEQRLHSLSIIQEGSRLRCWYAASIPKQDQKLAFQDERAIEPSGSAVCYAESTNGFDWIKPNLGVCSFNGSKDNNIVSYAHFIGSVFHDENGPAEERYKSFEFGKLPAEELARGQGGNFNTYCLYALVSPDGYHWRSMTNPLVRHFCDTQNVGAWDPVLKKYVGYFRDHQGGRAISRSETEDFHSWPPPQPLLVPGPEDNPDVDYYSNSYTTYPGKPSLRLLFPAIYHQASDRVNVRLAISLEGRAYSWISHDPIIELGKPGDWDGGQVYASPNLLRLKDSRLALPYGGNAETHNEAYFLAFYTNYSRLSGFGWALWDDARLAGIEAEEAGEFYTTSFRPEGEVLEVNARTSGHGRVAFELCQDGHPVQGFTLAENLPLQGDRLWVPVRWKGKPDISELKGKKLQLHVVITKGKVFAYRVTTSRSLSVGAKYQE